MKTYYSSSYCMGKRDEWKATRAKYCRDHEKLRNLKRILSTTREITYYGQLEFKKSNQNLNAGFAGVKAFKHKKTYNNMGEDSDNLEKDLDGALQRIDQLIAKLDKEIEEAEEQIGFWQREYEDALEREAEDEDEE